ncbi:hypothetical protein EBB07_12270 [Paenibacillaceae bacterium]|nr:hypothetical protein EBB07_12270 [Paenibacillaceae bacterium]
MVVASGNGDTQTYIVTVTRATMDSTITPSTASFDKYAAASGYADITVRLGLLGNTFQGIEVGGTPISATSYDVNGDGNEITLKKKYLATLGTGTHSFDFRFSTGDDATLTLTVSDSTPANSTPSTPPPVPIRPTDSNQQQNQLNITVNEAHNQRLLNGTIVKENGKEVLKLTLDPTEMISYVQQMARGETLSVGVNIAVDDILIDVDGDTIDLLIDKGIVFHIETKDGTMIWDASKVDLLKIKAQLGVTAFNQGVTVTFVMREQSSTSYPFLQKMSIIGQPLSMIVHYEKDNKVVSHVESKHYNKRILQLDPSAKLNNATAIVIAEDGSFVRVPTKIVMQDGNRYAEIYTFVDGTIALVSQQQRFVDIQGHWAQAAIEESASQLIVTGKKETNFAPNVDVTRAEFTAILGRAIGLVSDSYQGQFDDLHAENWSAVSIQSALNRSLIHGYEDGTFRPEQSMTKEEAIVVITRALQMVGDEIALSDDKVKQILAQYSDANKVSGWAKKAVAVAIETGILQGKTSHTLASQESITRAEIVIMIRRMLEYANLI